MNELHIKYKSETGLHAEIQYSRWSDVESLDYYDEDNDFDYANIPTPEYVKWLEELALKTPTPSPHDH